MLYNGTEKRVRLGLKKQLLPMNWDIAQNKTISIWTLIQIAGASAIEPAFRQKSRRLSNLIRISRKKTRRAVPGGETLPFWRHVPLRRSTFRIPPLSFFAFSVPKARISRGRCTKGGRLRRQASALRVKIMMPNQAYIRVGSIGSGGSGAAVANGGGGTLSPPASPRRSPRMHRRGAKDGGSFGGRRLPPVAPRTLAQRMMWMLLSLFLRRQAIFLFAPLIYVSGMLLYMGTVSLDSVPAIISRPAPGSVYRSPQLYQRLRADMDADNSSDGVSLLPVFSASLVRKYSVFLVLHPLCIQKFSIVQIGGEEEVLSVDDLSLNQLIGERSSSVFFFFDIFS